jgi:hypothetical protein
VLRARCAAHSKWSQVADRTAATEKARKAFNDRFEREVDPDGVLSPEERARRAESARKAFYHRLALRSAVSRRKARAARLDAEAAEAEAELSELDDAA